MAWDGLAWLRAHPPDLAWLGRPRWHSFRWRDDTGRWWSARERPGTGARLVETLARSRARPTDLYVGTSAWLDPVDLPRLRDLDRPAPILLDHLVVLDVDRAPFSRVRIGRARRDTRALVRWLTRETTLEIVHVAFSGAKGFHVVARDPDRAPFALPDPRARERAVREARAALLARVRAAGHEVDPTVTADTRRVIRLPGSLHGATGWACAILPDGALDDDAWIATTPRAEGALVLPARAGALPRPATRPPPGPDGYGPTMELQASSHVAGTRDRGALLVWVRLRPETVQARLRAAGLGPALLWTQGTPPRTLVLVPRALPRPALERAARAMGLAGFASALRARGHAWVGVAPRADAADRADAPLVPAGVLDGVACAFPWSRPHLDLARRLDQPCETNGAHSGAARATLRLAQLR